MTKKLLLGELKGKWTREEEVTLREAVATEGTFDFFTKIRAWVTAQLYAGSDNWPAIAKNWFGGNRSATQCLERWQRVKIYVSTVMATFNENISAERLLPLDWWKDHGLKKKTISSASAEKKACKSGVRSRSLLKEGLGNRCTPSFARGRINTNMSFSVPWALVQSLGPHNKKEWVFTVSAVQLKWSYPRFYSKCQPHGKTMKINYWSQVKQK